MNKLIAFEIPESPSDIASWLESVLCKGDLRGLVAQLASVHDGGDTTTDLELLLGSDRQAVLANGLTALPIGKLQALLTSPQLLLELQQTVMAEGGDYWLGKFECDAGQETIHRTSDTITQILRPQQVAVDTDKATDSTRPMLAILMLAAGILLVISGTWYWTQQNDVGKSTQVAVGWGWAAESGIPSGGSAEDYLTALASGADAWFNKRPVNRSELVTRLKEFSAGCDLLINADHAPLGEQDRAWLRFKCRGWKKRIDQQIAAADQNSTSAILRVADDIASDIAKSLKGRASKV